MCFQSDKSKSLSIPVLLHKTATAPSVAVAPISLGVLDVCCF